MATKVDRWVPPPQFIKDNPDTIDRNLLYRLIAEGKVPHIKLGAKKLLIPSNLFELLYEQGQIPP